MSGDLERRFISDEMKESYINYAMSVIIGRALPDVRDGLKPVHRRILWGMHQAGHTHEKGYSKSARSVGEVMGKYHPHGDQALYDTMVRMAQDFSLRYPLVDGQGNFGSIDGDPPAAMRYTESRLDRLSSHMLDDINKDTIDMVANFDDSEIEPTVLPSRLPNLLLNGSDGIAVGMATKIPPHNLNEVAAAVRFHTEKVIEEDRKRSLDKPPKIDAIEYMEYLKGPDFPTGATIYGIDGILDMYRTGQGRFHIRSDAEVRDDSSGKKIIITSIPYQVRKAGMLKGIAELVTKEIIKGIRDIRDESSKEGIRVVIEVKNNADPHAILNQLYRSSRLQESYSANMMGILNEAPVQLDLSTILHTYVRHRESVIERRTQFELNKAEARAHILEGLMAAQKRMTEIIEVGRNSDSRDQFESYLRGDEKYPKIKRFDFSEKQAKAIAERRLYQLTKLNVKEVEEELGKLKEAIKEYKSILDSRKRRLEILISELENVVEKHGDERRSHIDPTPLSMDREDLVAERALVISLTQDNYIRHLPVEAFRLQNRGGKGLKGVATKDEDAPAAIVTCFSKDRLLIFTDQGRVYGLRAWETPLASRYGRGTHIRNLLQKIRDDEKVISILPMDRELIEDPEGHYLIFATSQGRIKRSRLSEYVRINRNGKYALKFATDTDSLVQVRPATDADHVVLVSSGGYACRFLPSEVKTRTDPSSGEVQTTHTVRVQGRVSQGVSGMKLSPTDSVIGMIVTDDADTSVLTISKYGMAKRSRLGSGSMVPVTNEDGSQVLDNEGEPVMERDGYRKTNRGTKGVRTMALSNEDEIVGVRQIPELSDQLFMLTGSGMMIRMPATQTKETLGKVTKGTRIMELRDSDKKSHVDEIIFVARLPAELIDGNDEDSEGSSEEE
ncbi:MAG: DNA topoisomerase (ATP-hydrolyzing) subunit A [Candidatus Thermoplasmatota archaeon]|nr:DNA topoisomerase (ATP-hydrolyzing) subunit A [Candidatus Thermoplasmatota archaeon]MEC8954630.1 DNA topoisomerase (ATP-hydrolyzing) subunit A [Candidatus Thermoplasmatota archaeon]MED6312969.1 DNA topoisomerase (ATP-hydrolyzing) subunit A [Candidatus Thermoplasmatota archaeon]MEE3201197.1 DNA topoisomerase (ATP-hydrolyzing) subunit A [Candidatus Thermoplasmatota archaeon]